MTKSYAILNSDKLVVNVIAIEPEMVATGLWGDPHNIIQTCYHTYANVHYGPDGLPDGGVALRKNYAGIGYTYDPIRDAFIPPKPYDSWHLDESSCQWAAPVPIPDDINPYIWNENNLSWELQNIPVSYNPNPLSQYTNK